MLQKRTEKHKQIRDKYRAEHQDKLVQIFADYYNKRDKELREQGKNFRTAIERGLYAPR